MYVQSDRDGSASPKRRSETPSTDSSDEEGQINKAEEAYDNAQSKQAAESVSLGDLEKARITRDMLAKFCLAPWFEDYVKGAVLLIQFRLLVTLASRRWLGEVYDWCQSGKEDSLSIVRGSK